MFLKIYTIGGGIGIAVLGYLLKLAGGDPFWFYVVGVIFLIKGVAFLIFSD